VHVVCSRRVAVPSAEGLVRSVHRVLEDHKEGIAVEKFAKAFKVSFKLKILSDIPHVHYYDFMWIESLNFMCNFLQY